MTEPEKLRALLAEAREWFGATCGKPNCTEGICPLRDRIGAALAEPMELSYTQEDVNRMTDEMIAVRKEYESLAFKRGAEAMREQMARTYWQMAPAVRDLPIPKDEK